MTLEFLMDPDTQSEETIEKNRSKIEMWFKSWSEQQNIEAFGNVWRMKHYLMVDAQQEDIEGMVCMLYLELEGVPL